MREKESKVNRQTGKYKSGECKKNGEMTLFNVKKKILHTEREREERQIQICTLNE